MTSIPDPMDAALHTAGPPSELFADLRARCPVQRTGSYWSLTGDAAVVEVDRDAERFSSWLGGIYLHPDQVAPLDLLRNVLLFMDPPEHSRYRRILSSVFTPKAVAAVEPAVRARVGAALDAIAGAGRCDLVADVAVPVPLGVLADLMGIPDADIPRLLTWTHQIERAQYSPEPAQALDVFGEMVGYLHPLVQRQAETGGDNLVTRLRDARVDGEGLTDEQILGFFALLVFAGNDTTRNTFATGVLALLRHPEQWRLLRAEPARIPNAVEEILRWTSVVKHFVRTATRDTELAGVPIAQGDKLVMWFGAASRDPALNPDPERFDVTRADPRHRAFGGGGPHFCLGNALARLELRVLLEELTARLPDLTLDGEPEYLTSNWVHGLTTLPVRF